MTNFDLEAHRKQFREIMEKYKARVVVCGGTGCMANGSGEIIEEFHRVMKEKGLSYAVAEAKEKADCYMAKSGCQGPYTKIDLGIVKYHFELGAGKENFIWG